MSVDMIMYKVNKLTGQDLVALKNAHFYDIDTLCPEEGWEYKAYLKSDVEKNPERFAEIMKYMRPMTLRRTITDHKQCYIDHGMPADAASYCCAHHSYEMVLRWDDNVVKIPREELKKYSHEEEAEFYVMKIHDIDCDVSNYMAKTMVNALESELGGDYCYRPCLLTKQMADRLAAVLLKEYDEDDLYSIDGMMDFIMELMRAFVNPQKGLFVEFQD